MRSIQKILVPIDVGAESAPIVELASELAVRFGASIDFFHVWQPPTIVPMELFVTLETGGPLKRAQDVAQSMAAAQLKALADKARAAGVAQASCRVGVGDPATDIIDLAGAGHYDLVVMGTHGRGGWSHALIGSVAEKVLRRSPCPVLTVRAK